MAGMKAGCSAWKKVEQMDLSMAATMDARMAAQKDHQTAETKAGMKVAQ